MMHRIRCNTRRQDAGRPRHRSGPGFADIWRTEIAAAGIYGKRRLSYRRIDQRPIVTYATLGFGDQRPATLMGELSSPAR